MNITTGNFEIIDSGAVIVPSCEYLEFEIKSLRFRFIFQENKDTEGHQTTPNITGTLANDGVSDYLSITVINFKSLFASPNQMLEVGTLEGKKLYVRFSVVPIGAENEQTRIFNYTWYKEK